MICENCGAESGKHARFCGKCGRKLPSSETSTYSNTEKKKRKFSFWIILFIILGVFILSGSLFVVTQRKKIKENPYDYNPVEEKITAVFDWMTGNRNSISVSDDMRNMKYLSERIARNLLQQMKTGKELGLPEEICNMAEDFTDIKSGKIEYMDYFTNLNDDVLNEIQDKPEITENDLRQSCISIIVGRIADANSLALTNVFHRKMIVKKEEQIQNSIWILHYTDQFSIGIVFTEDESVNTVDAYPIAIEDIQEFYDTMELFFNIHERYY